MDVVIRANVGKNRPVVLENICIIYHENNATKKRDSFQKTHHVSGSVN